MNVVNESGAEGGTGANRATSDHSVDSDRDDPTNRIDCWRLPPFRCNHAFMHRTLMDWWADIQNDNLHYYYIVAKPYDSGYVKFAKTYQKNCLDYVRRYLNPEFYFMVKETNAAKTHVHMIIATSEPHRYEDLSKRKTPRYKFHVDEINLAPKSIDRLFEYMIKESKFRMLNLYSDYGLKK